MKLYYTKGACSLAVRIIINELSLPSDYEAIDLQTKRTEEGEDYLKINPKGAVPTLKLDNGEILTENAAILQYLADRASAFQLLPPVSDFKRYRVLEWLNYVSTELHKSFGVLFNPTISQDTKETIIKLIKYKFSYLDKHLLNSKYLYGENFTLPDAYLFVMLNWSLYFKFNLKEWPNLNRYYLELKKRPSIAESLEQEALQETLA